MIHAHKMVGKVEYKGKWKEITRAKGNDNDRHTCQLGPHLPKVDPKGQCLFMFDTIYCDLLARAFFSYHGPTLIRAKGMHPTRKQKYSVDFTTLLLLLCFKGEREGDERLHIA